MTPETKAGLVSCADQANEVYEAINKLVTNLIDDDLQYYLVGKLGNDRDNDPQNVIDLLQDTQVIFENIVQNVIDLLQDTQVIFENIVCELGSTIDGGTENV